MRGKEGEGEDRSDFRSRVRSVCKKQEALFPRVLHASWKSLLLTMMEIGGRTVREERKRRE